MAKKESKEQELQEKGTKPRKGLKSGAENTGKSHTQEVAIGKVVEEVLEVEKPEVIAVEAEHIVPLEEEQIVVKKQDEKLWEPRTLIGKKVKSGEIKTLEEVFNLGYKLMETQIVDVLVPNLQSDLILVGQSKGKFGGGQRRVFRQTQKKTMEGNKPSFSTIAVVGNQDGIVGIGYGKAKETVPAREKALRNAKLNVFMIRRGCGSWLCNCGKHHSIPYTVRGKSGSVIVELRPAPRGKGLVAPEECKKIMRLAGIRDLWSRVYGCTSTRANMIVATVLALQQLMQIKVQSAYYEKLGVVNGSTGVLEVPILQTPSPSKERGQRGRRRNNKF